MSTIFSKIINRDIEAKIIYEDNDVLAFEDIQPQAPIHILIIPKIEIPTLNDIDKDNIDVISKMFLAAKNLAKNLDISENGYRLVINCNNDGGQSVYHIHMHLLGGRTMNWPPG